MWCPLQWLRYEDKTTHARLHELTSAYSAFIVREQVYIRAATALFALFNVALLVVDYQRLSSTDFAPAAAVRLGVIAPCVAIVLFTYSSLYKRYSNWLVLPLVVVGGCTIAYASVARDRSYGVLCLFISYIFSFTPLPVLWSTATCVLLVIGYVVTLYSDTQLAAVGSASDTLDLVGVLVAFVLLNAVVGYLLERSLKQTVLTEYVLYSDGDALQTQHELATQLLRAMLPSAVLKQLKNGHKLIADNFDCVTVLFCEVCNFHTLTDAQRFSPDVCIRALNIIYSGFDQLIEQYRYLHKVRVLWFFSPSLVIWRLPSR